MRESDILLVFELSESRYALLISRKFNASEIKHVAHGEGVAGKCVDDEPAEAVEGPAVPALHIQHGSGTGICEAVVFAA